MADEEQLRREVVEAVLNAPPHYGDKRNSVIASRPAVVRALDALRDHYQAPKFEGDEAEVRKAAERRAQEGDSFGSDVIRSLDAKDAEIAELKLTQYRDTRAEQAEAERDEALADLKDCARGWQDHHAKYRAQAEAALAERDAVITVAIPLLERSPDANVNWLADKFRFILPAKPVDLFKKAVEEASEAYLAGTGDLHEHLRAAIERAGGTIEFPDALLAQRSTTNG